MPKIPKNYNNTVFYKIQCNDETVLDIYVGHTTDFKQRERRHREDCIKKSHQKIYTIINQNGG